MFLAQKQEKIIAALNEVEVGTFILCDNRVFRKVKAEKGISVDTVLANDYTLLRLRLST